MKHIDRGRANLILSTAAFTASSAGSVLLHIVLAIAIYSSTSSGFMTAVFVSLQWVPALLVVLFRSDWDRGMNPRKRWIILDFVSAALTVPIIFLVGSRSFVLVAIILLVRGLVDHVNRINKTVAARVLFPNKKATHYASFLQSSYHVGIGLAALLGAVYAENLDLQSVAILDAVTFVISAVLISFSRCVEQISNVDAQPQVTFWGRLLAYASVLRKDSRLLMCAMIPPLTATFFQGSYSALQPIFPIDGLGLGAKAVSMSYVLSSVAIIAGSTSFSIVCRKFRFFERDVAVVRRLATVLSWSASLLYVATVMTHHPIFSAIFFGLMIFVFEFLWMLGYSGIVAYAPKGQLSSVFGISFAIGCFFASALAMAVGSFLDLLHKDFLLVVSGLMVAFLGIACPLIWRSKRGAF